MKLIKTHITYLVTSTVFVFSIGIDALLEYPESQTFYILCVLSFSLYLLLAWVLRGEDS